jgi:hypothetical protein
MAQSVQWVAVVLGVTAHVDLCLTESSIVRLAYASAVVHDLEAVALPRVDILMAYTAVLARLAGALVHVDITVAAFRRW